MLHIDLHMHTINSLCGHHTALEVMRICRDNGAGLIALTDHCPGIGGTARGTFFDPRRFPREFEGMIVLKGMEVNIVTEDGMTDTPKRFLNSIDVLVAGLHPTPFPSDDMDRNTEAVVALMRRGLPVDILSHPDLAMYPVDMDRLVPAAVESGVALELNNSCVRLQKSDPRRTRRMIELGYAQGALFAVNSDAHTWPEFNVDDDMRQFLRDIEAPPIDILNDWPIEKVLARLEQRKQRRVAFSESA